MSVLYHISETPGGIPVLSVWREYEPCTALRRGEQLRARAVMRGEVLVCPRCERMCELPGSVVGQGDEFVVYR